MSPLPDKALFLDAQRSFCLSLFRHAINTSGDANALISPTSTQLALLLDANGMANYTRIQIESALGGYTVEQMNSFWRPWLAGIKADGALKSYQSLWYDKQYSVSPDFLQRDADVFSADLFPTTLNDSAVSDINDWINQNTNGMIPKMIDQLEPNSTLVSINALTFESKWKTGCKTSKVYFRESAAVGKNVPCLVGEAERYISDGKVLGCIKDYANDRYAFVALMPNEDTSLHSFIADLTSEKLNGYLSTPVNNSIKVKAYIPVFSANDDRDLKPIMQSMGVLYAFDASKADFSFMFPNTKPGGVWIGKMQQKTSIEVNTDGTKASAVTRTEKVMKGFDPDLRTVTLDRPFMYMIVDKTNNLPIFMGTFEHAN